MRPIVVALIVLLPLAAHAEAGAVSFLEGEATVTPRGGEALPLQSGASVDVGDLVETAPGGRVELTLADGSVVRLGEKSRLSVDAVSKAAAAQNWTVNLSLGLGSLWAKVTKRIAGENTFEVSTERVVAGVRGTEFLVDAGEEHAVSVLEGEVQVGARDDKGALTHFSVRANQRIRVDGKLRCSGREEAKVREHKLVGWKDQRRQQKDRDERRTDKDDRRKDKADRRDRKEGFRERQREQRLH